MLPIPIMNRLITQKSSFLKNYNIMNSFLVASLAPFFSHIGQILIHGFKFRLLIKAHILVYEHGRDQAKAKILQNRMNIIARLNVGRGLRGANMFMIGLVAG